MYLLMLHLVQRRRRFSPIEEAKYFIRKNIDRDGLVKRYINQSIGIVLVVV